MRKVAVVGCGPIGLTTACMIQEKLHNVQVIIYTENESPNTTGDISAGFWTPVYTENTPIEHVMRWSRRTLKHLIELWKSGKANETGLSLVPVLMLSEEPNFSVPEWSKIAIGYTELSPEDIQTYCVEFQKNFKGGFTYISFTWEPSIFLPYLKKKFLEKGGLDAKYLLHDEKLYPVRGQLQRVSAPWLFQVIFDSECYIIPNINCVILGGTKQKNDYETIIREDDKNNIVKRCTNLEPSLKESILIKDMVGLRPCRTETRLELEILNLNEKHLPIIYNYGHGGSGVTFSYGCAWEACDLVNDALNIINAKNKSKL